MAPSLEPRLAPIGTTFLADVDDEESRALLRSFETAFGQSGPAGGASGIEATRRHVTTAAQEGLHDEDLGEKSAPLCECQTFHRRWHTFSYLTYLQLRGLEVGSSFEAASPAASQERVVDDTLMVGKAEAYLSDDEGSTVPATSAECTPLCSPNKEVRVICLEGLVAASSDSTRASRSGADHALASYCVAAPRPPPPPATCPRPIHSAQGPSWCGSGSFLAAAHDPQMPPPFSPGASSSAPQNLLHADELVVVPFAQIPRCPAPTRPADPAKLPPSAPWLRRPPTPLSSATQITNLDCAGERARKQLRARGKSLLLSLGSAPWSPASPVADTGGSDSAIGSSGSSKIGSGTLRAALREKGQQLLSTNGRQV
mmetsp:Transcript_132999/g.331847  ORF Transcript_132999/g.331847 Transcript_132999/m.331847 type:complete len:371 (-) Transcript_132999:111-1223(-)